MGCSKGLWLAVIDELKTIKANCQSYWSNAGFQSAESTTRNFVSTFAGLSFSPSCSSTAAKKPGKSDSFSPLEQSAEKHRRSLAALPINHRATRRDREERRDRLHIRCRALDHSSYDEARRTVAGA